MSGKIPLVIPDVAKICRLIGGLGFQGHGELADWEIWEFRGMGPSRHRFGLLGTAHHHQENRLVGAKSDLGENPVMLKLEAI